jgi:carboxy-terminal domain RNA polymerase II polypeptide A small phosphatase
MVAQFDKLLVLDMDETLVHADERLVRYEFAVGPYRVVRRPHVERFLAFAFEHFTAVGVWTAASRGFAVPVLDQLLDRKRLAFLWCRERCGRRWDPETGEIIPLKDLRKLRKRGYDERKVLFVDDTPAKLQRSYGNLVAVRPFVGDPADDELIHLEHYLRELGTVENVRTVEKRGWRSRRPPVQPPSSPGQHKVPPP